jgi:hypothetical protein
MKKPIAYKTVLREKSLMRYKKNAILFSNNVSILPMTRSG